MHVLGQYKFKCFVYYPWLSCVSHFIDIYTAVIKNIRKMHNISIRLQIFSILTIKDAYCIQYIMSNYSLILSNVSENYWENYSYLFYLIEYTCIFLSHVFLTPNCKLGFNSKDHEVENRGKQHKRILRYWQFKSS